MRRFPLPLGANLPELDAPAWWHLKHKQTMYYDGRTDARSVRTNMQFLLGEKTLEEFKALEPTFRDIQAYLLSLEPPKYPFPIDAARPSAASASSRRPAPAATAPTAPNGSYPNKIVPLDVIGTDPARSLGISDRLVAHYNSTWFGESYPVDTERVGYQAPPLDGIWATAPYLHNGSVPTLHACSSRPTRPARFTRPPSTDFEHYDRENVGWKFHEVSDRGTGLDRQALAASGPVHRRHLPVRPGQRRAYLRRQARRRRSGCRRDRVSEDAVSSRSVASLLRLRSHRLPAPWSPAAVSATCPASRKARRTLPPRILWTSASE